MLSRKVLYLRRFYSVYRKVLFLRLITLNTIMDLRTELEQLLKLHPILSMATIADELRLPLKNVHNLCYRMLKWGRIRKVDRKVALADISMAPKPVASLTEPSQHRSLRANDLKQMFLDYNKYVER